MMLAGMTTCSRQSVQVHPSEEGRLFHYRQVHRCPVRTYEGRSYPVFLQMASLFPASGKFFVPPLRPCALHRSRQSSRIVLRMICAERASSIKYVPGNAGGSRQSRILRARGGNQGGDCEGGRSTHDLRSGRNLIQPVRHAFDDGACPVRRENHRHNRRARHSPLF